MTDAEKRLREATEDLVLCSGEYSFDSERKQAQKEWDAALEAFRNEAYYQGVHDESCDIC